MQTLVFHPGTQHSRQTALALQELERLAFLATGMFDHPESAERDRAGRLPQKLQQRLLHEMARFASPGLDPGKVRAFPRYELPERLAARLGARNFARRLDTALNAAFGRKVAMLAKREGPFVLWGYDGSSFSAFGDARTSACPKVLDRTIADGRYWNEEVSRIADTHDDWLTGGTPRWSPQRVERDDSEYEHADLIVCGSPFVMRSIAEYSRVPGVASKCRLLPYSFDERLFGGAPEPEPVPTSEPVRFLFAGQVSARKGVQHLLEAFARLPASAAKLTLVGPVMVPERLLAPYRDRIEILGSVPRAEMPGIMRRHHALVFPSHFEGSAVVLVEAMASGLAIIQTAAAGLGASERSGIVLERPEAGAVEEAMAALIKDHERLHSMRRAAQAEAQDRNFAAYRSGVAAALAEVAD